MNKSLTVIAILIIALLTGCDSDGVLSDAEEIARTSGSATQKASVGFDTLDIYRADGLALVWCVILRSKISHDAGRPVTLDSLLEKSIKYCETFPESSERAHINYYAGLARMERGRYAQAIVDFANSLHTVSISDGLIESCYPELTGHLNLNTALAYAALGDSVNAYSARERAVLAFTESGLDSLAQVAAATPLIVLTDSVDYETFIANSARLISDNIEYLTRRPDQEKKWFTNMFAACCLILIIIFTSSLINKYRKRQHRKERNADLAAINHYISLLDSAISQIENQHAENTTMREEIADLTAARYDVLNAVCYVLFALPDSNRHSDKSFARVIETIKSLGTSDQNITKIEQETNRNFSNIISRLRSELPDLKEEEIRLFLYIVIGFTPRTLSVILDLPLDTVYNRKSYLKRKIKTASTPSRDDFLHHL